MEEIEFKLNPKTCPHNWHIMKGLKGIAKICVYCGTERGDAYLFEELRDLTRPKEK